MSERPFVIFAVDDPALPGHFPGAPVVPGSLLVDWVLGQAGSPYCDGPVMARNIKFLRPVSPGEKIELAVKKLDDNIIAFTLTHKGEVVATGQVRAGV